MPPSQFLKQSKTKMQAWVTSNGLSNSQTAPIGPASGYDGPSSPQKRHVYLPQPVPPVTQPLQTAPAAQATEPTQNSPPRSRAPIVHANSNRAAMTNAARLPVPSYGGHTRNVSLNNMARTRTVGSEPIQQPSRRQMPFWEGSTIDGSVFSDTASTLDANPAGPSQYRMPIQAPIYQQRDTPRPRPIKKEPDVEVQRPPFVIASNGRIDIVDGPLTRSASTPDARNHRGNYKDSSPEPDQYSEDSPDHTSPEKSPSVKRLHHAKPLTLRTNQRGSLSKRTAYPQEENVMSSPQNQPYQRPDDDADDVRSEHSERRKTRVHEPQRSTIFADTDTPMVSHPDESEAESVEQPTPKPVAKAKPQQVSRKLFISDSKNRLTLHESPMPRPTVEKRQPSAKKRQFELDYDDGALAAMDYTALKNEAFDFDPARAEMQSAVGPPRGTLPEKLDHFLDKDEASQMEFFTKMPINDWESSGDWFLERFTEVMQHLKEARQAKRAMVENFEEEIAERQEAVQNKIQGIGQTLADLKSEGEGLMVGKEFD